MTTGSEPIEPGPAVNAEGTQEPKVFPDLDSAKAEFRLLPRFQRVRDGLFAAAITAVDLYSQGHTQWKSQTEVGILAEQPEPISSEEINFQESDAILHEISAAPKRVISAVENFVTRPVEDKPIAENAVVSMHYGFTEAGVFDDSQVWLTFSSDYLEMPRVSVADPASGSTKEEVINCNELLGEEVANFMTAFGYAQVNIGGALYDSPDLGRYAEQGLTFALTPLEVSSRYNFPANAPDSTEHRVVDANLYADHYSMLHFDELDQERILALHREINHLEGEVAVHEAAAVGDLISTTGKYRDEKYAAERRKPEFRRLANPTLRQVEQAISAYSVGAEYEGRESIAPDTLSEMTPKNRSRWMPWARGKSRKRPDIDKPEPEENYAEAAVVPAVDRHGAQVEGERWIKVHVGGPLPTVRVAYYDYLVGRERHIAYSYSLALADEVIEYMGRQGFAWISWKTVGANDEHRNVALQYASISKDGLVFRARDTE